MTIDLFIKELQDFLSNSGISQNELAQRAGVPQSQVSDWSKGKIKRFGKNAKKVLDVIESYRISDSTPLPKDLQTVIRDFYGGKKENSDLLIGLISSLKPLIAK